MQRVGRRAEQGAAQDNLLSRRAYVRLKEKILMAEIPPLGAIDEQALSAELEVGRTPIREALQRLAHEGLVTIIPYRGTVASGVDMSDLHQIMEMRIPLEILAGRLAAQRVQPGEVAGLRARIAETDLERACREQDFVALLRLDQWFHHEVARLADNRFIEQTLDNLRDLTWRYYVMYYRRNPPRPTDSFTNYAEVLEALERRDADAVTQALELHFKDSRALFPGRL